MLRHFPTWYDNLRRALLVTGEHWTGSPNKSIDQIGKNCPKNVPKLCFQLLQTIFGHFFDVFFRHYRTFCRHSLFWAVQRFARYNALPFTHNKVVIQPYKSHEVSSMILQHCAKRDDRLLAFPLFPPFGFAEHWEVEQGVGHWWSQGGAAESKQAGCMWGGGGK